MSESKHSIRNLSFRGVTLDQITGRPALLNADFDFPENRVFWVKAGNGGGKSHLLRLLGGIEQPSTGAYLMNGKDITQLTFEEFAPMQRRIGYSFEFGGLLSNKTIRQNLMLPFFYHRDLSGPEADKRVAEYSAHFDLKAVSDLRPASCSGGRRKAGCVARALITRPELLLMDHPTAGLDERTKKSLVELLLIHRAEHGLKHVFIVTDDDRFMSQIDHTVLTLSDQKLKAA